MVPGAFCSGPEPMGKAVPITPYRTAGLHGPGMSGTGCPVLPYLVNLFESRH
jgi:hypothetical protein